MRLLERGLRALVCALFVILLGATVSAVFCRYVLNDSLVWAEELGRYVFIWIVFIGATLGVAHGAHVSVDSVVARLPSRSALAVRLATQAGVLAFLVVLLVQGTKLAVFGLRSYSLAMEVPMAWVYASLPISAALMTLYALERLRHLLAESLRRRE